MVSGLKAHMGIVSEDEVLVDKPNSRNQRYKRKQLDRCPTKISDQDTDQVNDILGWDLDHKPIEQRRAGRDDGFPPARRIIGRENTWTSSRKRRAPVKAPIFGLEQFPQTNGNVSGIQTFGCLSHATSKPFPCWRGNKKSKRRQPCWLISMK